MIVAGQRFTIEAAPRRPRAGGRHRRGGVVRAVPRPDLWANGYAWRGCRPALSWCPRRGAARSRLVAAAVAELGTKARGVPVQVDAVEGAPAQVLVDAWADATELVVGHRGRGGLRSAVLGSVGLCCVLRASCPVTVVRVRSGVVRDRFTPAAPEPVRGGPRECSAHEAAESGAHPGKRDRDPRRGLDATPAPCS